MTKKRIKICIIGGIILVFIAIMIGFIFKKIVFQQVGGHEIYVESVGRIMNPGAGNGRIERFSGLVETQKQVDIQPEGERQIKEIRVSEGDQITTGMVLFTYDTEQEAGKLAKLQLELERINSIIANKTTEISELEKEKNSVSKEAQLDYTMQIQSAQIELKQNEIERKAKEVEMTKLQSAMGNSEVKSPIDGVIKQVNKDNAGSSSAFMTIISMGDYRIKCKINEQNMGIITAGQKVIVHSRINFEKQWYGTVSEVNTQKPVNNNGESGGMESEMHSSSYHFYVNLDSSEGLMLGQHVYVEADEGQMQKKEGIWLDESYIVIEDDKAYVWADNGKGEIEQKRVELGEHNEELFQYEIKNGLSVEDKIAFPDPEMKKGMKINDVSMEEVL